MNKKKRVLVSGEFSQSASGFAEYTKHLCEELSKIYTVAELSSYGRINDKRDRKIGRWKYYANAVDEDDPEFQHFKKSTINQFGYRFHETLLDFYPDYVLTMKDPSMYIHEYLSPLREFYFHIQSPTVDSAPQIEDWLSMFEDADKLLTYSEYGYNVLRQELNNSQNLFGVAYPGVSEEFKPLNKDDIRKKFEVPQEWIIIGMVARNQRRKLFLDLIDSFKIYLDKTKVEHPNLYKNTYLYFHTSVIDLNPFNIVKYLKMNGLGHRVLFSYKCEKCQHYFCDFYKGMKTTCKKCGSNKAIMPTVGYGFSKEELVEVYNLFDVSVQYNIAEGSGFPVQEAASCGVVPAATNCTATSDSIRLLNGIPIDIQRNFHDIDVDTIRYLPDNQDLVNKLIEFLKLPRQIRLRRGFECSELAKKYFNWEKNTKVWIDAIESIDETQKKSWDAPYQDYQPNYNIPQNLSEKDFVYWCIDNILLRPKDKHTFSTLNTIKNLQIGLISDNNKLKKFDHKMFYDSCCNRIKARIHYEKIRCGQIILPEKKFIKYSRIKEMLYDC